MTGTPAAPGTDKNQERDETVEGQRCGGAEVWRPQGGGGGVGC